MSPIMLLPGQVQTYEELVLSTNPLDWWKLDDASPASAPANELSSRGNDRYYSTGNIAYQSSGACAQSTYSIYNTTYPYNDGSGTYGMHFQPGVSGGTNRDFPNAGSSIAFWYKDTGWWDTTNWPGLLNRSNGSLVETVNSDGFSFYIDRTGETNGSPTSFDVTCKFRDLYIGTGLNTIQNTWIHVAFVRESNGYLTTYRNGSQVGQITNASFAAAVDTTARDGTTDWTMFGKGLGASNGQYHLDEVMLWNKALTGTEVSDIYDAATAA